MVTKDEVAQPCCGSLARGAVLFFAVAAFCAATDLGTKYWAFQKFFVPAGVGQVEHWLIPGVLGVQTSTNPGALFGMGRGYSLWFAGASVVFFVIIVFWLFGLGGARDRWLALALGMISGGIFGNFYDRIGWGHLPGYPDEIRHHVRDWILFRLQGVPGFDPWPNFNIADSCLVVGACLLVLHSFFARRPTPAPDRADHV